MNTAQNQATYPGNPSGVSIGVNSGHTTTPPKEEESALKRQDVFQTTERKKVNGKTYKLVTQETNNPAPEPILPRGKMEANGAVKSIEEQFVVCEIYTSNQNREVRLPKDLFPESELFFGMPIKLALIEQNGYRTPQVSVRHIEKKPDSLHNELSAIIDDLGN